jgi:hypothetical protein
MRFARLEALPETGHHTHRNVQWTQHLTLRTILAIGMISLRKNGRAMCNRQTKDSICRPETLMTTWLMVCP